MAYGFRQFLVRRLNSLYLVDANLHEKLLLQSPQDLLWVSVAPDSSQILVETADDLPRALLPRPPRPQKRKPNPDSLSNFWIAILWRRSELSNSVHK